MGVLLNPFMVQSGAAATVPGAPPVPYLFSEWEDVSNWWGVIAGWDPPVSDGGSAITGYVVQQSGFTEYTTTDVNRFSNEVMLHWPEQSMTIKVAAVNAIGQGPWSPLATIYP
jgi:hypothetical protein